MNKAVLALALALFPIAASGQDLVLAGKDGLREILSGYHEVPGPGYWARMEPESAKAALMELSSDPAEMIHIRTRATLALAHFPDGRVEQHLLSVIGREDREYVRAAAVTAYSKMAGEASVGALEKALFDKDGMVKRAAIKSLGRLGGERSRDILEKTLETEKNPAIRDLLKKSLAKTGRR